MCSKRQYLAVHTLPNSNFDTSCIFEISLLEIPEKLDSLANSQAVVLCSIYHGYRTASMMVAPI